jgi:dephospho-CoA kinase
MMHLMNSPSPGLRILGVMGGVGSGKSTVTRILAAEIPAESLDADALVSDLQATGPTIQAVEDRLGPGLLAADGSLDRQKLGKLVFSDSQAKTTLEEILHPPVREAIFQALSQWEGTGKPVWVVLDVPLLLEGGLIQICDFSFFLDVAEETRAKRAMDRHGWNQETWACREKCQASMADKKAAADAILANDADPDALTRAIQGWLPQLLALPPRLLRERWPEANSEPSK